MTHTHLLPITETLMEIGWNEVKTPSSTTYLGILLGRDLELTHVFDATMNKFVARCLCFAPTLRRLSVQKSVIITNIFLLPMFSYIHQFYTIPKVTIKAITTLLQRTLIRFNAYSLSCLQNPTKQLGLKRPLRNFELHNIACILALPSSSPFPPPSAPEDH